MSDGAVERESREMNEPVRFLGMKLEKCNLECLNPLYSLRNNLCEVGLDEAFVDDLKAWSENGVKKTAVRRLLEEVTRLFVEEDLTENWFSVFEDSTHPMSLRKNLTNGKLFLSLTIFLFYLFFFSLFAYNLQTKKRTTPQGAWKYIATLWRLRITSELKLHNTEVSLSA